MIDRIRVKAGGYDFEAQLRPFCFFGLILQPLDTRSDWESLVREWGERYSTDKKKFLASFDSRYKVTVNKNCITITEQKIKAQKRTKKNGNRQS